MQELTINLPIKDLLTLCFYLVAMFYIIFSIIFYYHWREYSVDVKVTKITLIFYWTTTISLMIILGIMTLLI